LARTVNAAARAVREDAFIDAAQRLIQTRGYEQFTVQDVLDDVGASKGAFYHYFDSKVDLANAVAERMADQASATIEPLLADPACPAAEKLEALFRSLAAFKAERKDLVLAILRVWLSDDNVLIRDKTRRLATTRLVPWLDRIVRQGVAEGVFTSRYPERLATVLAALIQGMGELASELWVGRQLGSIGFDDVVETFDAYGEALERILGAKPGSLTLIDRPTLELWFG
jgi:AcrR family transcriptional regulator